MECLGCWAAPYSDLGGLVGNKGIWYVVQGLGLTAGNKGIC